MAEEPIDKLPLIPDKVVDKVRAGKSVPIEEMVSERALEGFHAEQSRRSEPVHAESLQPISAAQAAGMRTQTGSMLPKMPTARRVIPRPFQRHSINLSVPWEARPEWHYVPAGLVLEGDIVPDVGKVVTIERVTVYADAADQALVVRDGEVLQALTELDQEGIEVKFGTMRVAVRVDIKLTGPAGKSLTFAEGAQVQVFRIKQEAQDA